MNHLLTILTFTPLAGALVLLLLPKDDVRILRIFVLGICGAAAILTGLVVSSFVPGAGVQLTERFAWIPTIHIEYFLGVDGKSILLLCLIAVVVPMAVLGSWSVTKNAKTYFFLLLLLQTGMFGVFTALSFFHWFLFWEFVLVPAYFLIKMWGGSNANAAALKFFLYTLVGSVCMLLSFAAIYLATGTFDFIELAQNSDQLPYKLARLAATAGLEWAPATASYIAFGGIVLACAIKTPMWPFHTWLPDVYSEAPSSVTMCLTAVLSKMGIYGFLRLAMPLFPEQMQVASELLLFFGVLTVVLGAFSAWAQTDLKRMVAFSSVNHVGYCLVGIFAAASVVDPSLATDRAVAIDGAVVQMFNHGITASALFFLLGALEERARTRGIQDFGGLRTVMPAFSLVFGIALFASAGLPGLNGFVGELLILKGAFAIAPLQAAMCLIGVVVTTVFLLGLAQRVFWGPVNERIKGLPDLTMLERTAAVVFVALIFFAGLVPGPFLALVSSP